MASVRHGGSNRRALSGKRAILKSALIKVSFVVLVMECTTRLQSGVLSGTHVRFGLFRHRNRHRYVQIIGLGDPLIPIKVIGESDSCGIIPP